MNDPSPSLERERCGLCEDLYLVKGETGSALGLKKGIIIKSNKITARTVSMMTIAALKGCFSDSEPPSLQSERE